MRKHYTPAFAPQRINANREFFRIQVEQAKAILELFHHEDVTEEVSDEIDNDLTDDDKAASAFINGIIPEEMKVEDAGVVADGTVTAIDQ